VVNTFLGVDAGTPINESWWGFFILIIEEILEKKLSRW
jgi:hypothetical protein